MYFTQRRNQSRYIFNNDCTESGKPTKSQYKNHLGICGSNAKLKIKNSVSMS